MPASFRYDITEGPVSVFEFAGLEQALGDLSSERLCDGTSDFC